jgi:hypothetical protein
VFIYPLSVEADKLSCHDDGILYTYNLYPEYHFRFATKQDHNP